MNKEVYQLIILDYINGSVHIYNIDSNVEVDEHYIDKLGFDYNNCNWMVGIDLVIYNHSNILKS